MNTPIRSGLGLEWSARAAVSLAAAGDLTGAKASIAEAVVLRASAASAQVSLSISLVLS
jgi:hypothetical protein